jgi:chorismate lyase
MVAMIHYATLKKVPHMTHSSSTPNWLSTPEGQGIKAELLPWMMYRGSLTNHLTKQSGKPCQVKVLKQAWELPHKDERHFLKLDKDEKVFVREVVLYGEKDWIYARSIFPKAVMQAHEEFLKIENRSLGEFLFKSKAIKRGVMEFANIKKGHYLYTQAQERSLERQETFWARRSHFLVDETNIIVCEVYLPSVLELLFEAR